MYQESNFRLTHSKHNSKFHPIFHMFEFIIFHFNIYHSHNLNHSDRANNYLVPSSYHDLLQKPCPLNRRKCIKRRFPVPFTTFGMNYARVGG